MKLSASALLISAALATIASAVPLGQVLNDPLAITQILTKRCSECTQVDGVALNLMVQESANHYSLIAHARLDNLLSDIKTAKVTSGAEELPQEKEMLSTAVQIKIEDAKRDCTPEALAPAIKDVVTSQATFDIPWSKKEEIENKMAELDVAITKLMLERIQNSINAELLSKDCTEKMTETVIVPAPPGPVAPEEPATPVAPAAPATPEAPAAAIPETSTPAVVPETPAPAAPAPAPAVQPGIDVPASVDPKYVCKSGCTDSQDAKKVLSIRVGIQAALGGRLDNFYAREVPAACTEQRSSLLGNVLSLVANLNVNAA
ncbi:hypothetical protein KVV02_004828 [Mortierella alpina]|uniref:Uncharacterized protein n=1 Tax=Mortierella alpina TaxID=64518 RepID=A0A9P8A2H0_MORAP|nr:hypothetical protein KVV02_004828 [Mortierella alpina]